MPRPRAWRISAITVQPLVPEQISQFQATPRPHPLIVVGESPGTNKPPTSAALDRKPPPQQKGPEHEQHNRVTPIKATTITPQAPLS
jgi:hypothetical protein